MSSRGLVKSMLVIGSAQSVNILVSLLRMKGLAILLGPTGVALLATFNNVLSTGTTLAGLGLGSSGVRQIAASRGSGEALSRVRHVLLWANLAQGGLAMIALWLVRERLALWLLAVQMTGHSALSDGSGLQIKSPGFTRAYSLSAVCFLF